MDERVPSRVQARDEPCADPASCDVHADEPSPLLYPPKPTLPKPPPAGIKPGPKWDSLSRAERRQLARHHRKVTGHAK